MALGSFSEALQTELEEVPSALLKATKTIMQEGKGIFVVHMQWMLSEAIGKTDWAANSTWEKVSSLSARSQCSNDRDIADKVTALKKSEDALTQLVADFKELSVEELLKKSEAAVTTQLKLLKQAYASVEQQLKSVGMDCTSNMDLRRVDGVTRQAMAGLSHMAMGKLLSLPNIKSPKNGIKVRAKLGDLLELCKRKKFLEFIGGSFIAGVHTVIDIDKEDAEVDNENAGKAKRGKHASSDTVASSGHGCGRAGA